MVETISSNLTDKQRYFGMGIKLKIFQLETHTHTFHYYQTLARSRKSVSPAFPALMHACVHTYNEGVRDRVVFGCLFFFLTFKTCRYFLT